MVSSPVLLVRLYTLVFEASEMVVDEGFEDEK